MISRQSGIYSIAITAVVSSGLTFFLSSSTLKQKKETTVSIPQEKIQTSLSCDYKICRLQGYKYVKPLVSAEQACESGKYNELKKNIQKFIESEKNAGNLFTASVYLRDFRQAEWMSINELEKYHPGSMIKVPILITYLKMEEKNPGMLTRKIKFEMPKGGTPHQTYNSKQIEAGKSYSIKELLTYMISYSDNNATYLLNINIDLEQFKSLFSDLGLTVPDIHDPNFQITADDYSVFMKVLYNASYLTIQNSEYSCELMKECDFKDGIVSGIPYDLPVIHKFGEWGDRNNPAIHQLHESGIVFLNGNPYLLTIMTQGKDVKKLPNVISRISEYVYKEMAALVVKF